MVKQEDFTSYEKTRVLGARALQIAMDAPLLTKIPKEKLEEVNYDPMEIAKIELDAGVLPINVKQPFPEKKNVKIKKAPEKKIEDKDVIKAEEKIEKEIEAEGEIMELATPGDEEEPQEVVTGRAASAELQ